MADDLQDLDSLEVLKAPISWGEIPIDYQMSRKIFRFPGTIEQNIIYSTERPGLFDIDMQFHTKAEEKLFGDFFIDKKGRWKRFWFPSPVNFFTLNADIINATDTVIILNNGFTEEYRGYERIYVKLTNGDYLTHKVTNVAIGPSGSEETLTLNTDWDRDVTIDEIEIFSLIHLCRFEKDQVEFVYETTNISTAKTTMLEMVKEYT